ncbi:MAG TPA: hypothetical protein P5081_00345 [Phycisphaerae bacterium]|nr:hypothetical protein [Phycisphaerae bacterium]HRW51302.1 hypothetical protein [Phycisphaerae bacterium]
MKTVIFLAAVGVILLGTFLIDGALDLLVSGVARVFRVFGLGKLGAMIATLALLVAASLVLYFIVP